jgi:hypothetical protein
LKQVCKEYAMIISYLERGNRFELMRIVVDHLQPAKGVCLPRTRALSSEL